MEKDTILVVENVSKQYRLGQVGTGTISHDLNRWWYKLRGKEDPYLKIGDTNDRSSIGESEYVWALKDINFEVKKGEVIGIIGKNGAGKSTLLKILSKVTAPTTGSVKFNGRIASLLEVGTGFHPELTGRENIYLNGAILGMTKKEIGSKINAIIEFSGCERYVDTPVKRYSSGMTVRLAFAVAAFLEPEILIIDEVLAVGDAEFQKKALGKMQDISKGEGRTVLFVSHNMAAVKSLCTSGIIIKNGKIAFRGNINAAVEQYLNDDGHEASSHYKNNAWVNNGIEEVHIQGENFFHEHNEEVRIQIKFQKNIKKCNVGVAVLNSNKIKIFTAVHPLQPDATQITCEIPSGLLLKGFYSIDVATFENETVYEYLADICDFQVVDLDNDYRIYGGDIGDLKINCRWFEE